MKLKKKTISIILISLLFLSNFIWLKLYLREHNKLTHAIIPTLSEDYFTTQKILTKYQMHVENNPYFNKVGAIAEIQYGKPLPYNMYFETKEDYQNYRKEYSHIIESPLILQNPDYPNGCEAASAVMMLQSLNIDITLKDFIDNYLHTDKVYEESGVRYGPDPSIVYRGSAASATRGWGTLQPVITKAISDVINEKNPNFFNNDMKTIVTNDTGNIPLYLISSNNYPSVIWVTQDYKESDEVYEWFSYDKKYTYTYPKKSHAVLLTGMDENYYYINDPLKEEKNIKVPAYDLEASFNSMGRQFISIN